MSVAFCRKYPEICERKQQDFSSISSYDNLGIPIRRQGVRPIRRQGVREIQPPIRRQGVREIQPPIRRQGRYDVREEEERQLQPPPKIGTTPVLENKIRKEYNKKLADFKENLLKKAHIGTEEIVEEYDQHKYGWLSEGAYKSAYKNKTQALKALKQGGEYIPELNDFEIIPEHSSYNATAYINKTTGEPVFAVRGSDTEFHKLDKNLEAVMRGKPVGQRLKKGVNDWYFNLWGIARGKGTAQQEFKDIEAQYLRFQEAINKPHTEISKTGHSKGGFISEILGKKYGGKTRTFNAAEHPFITEQAVAHPETDIVSYRHSLDGVSSGKITKKQPSHTRVVNLNEVAGKENEVIQHDLERFIKKPVRIGENGELIGEQTTRLRNVLGFMGGGAAALTLKNAIMAVPAYAIQPKYKTASERRFRNFQLGMDLTKGAIETEGASLLKLGEGGLPMISMGSLLGEEIGNMLVMIPEVRDGIDKAFGIKRKAYRFEKPPAVINAIGKLTGRAKQDAYYENIQKKADAYGIDFIDALNMTIETDEGVPLSEGAVEKAEHFANRANELYEKAREGKPHDSNLWVRYKNPNNPYKDYINMPLGTQERRDKQKLFNDWEREDDERAKAQYFMIQAEIADMERLHRIQEAKEASIKYEKSEQAKLDKKEQQMRFQAQPQARRNITEYTPPPPPIPPRRRLNI